MPRRKPPPEPDVRFRLYPEGRWFYFAVNVWPDKPTMDDHFEHIGGVAYRASQRDAVANCQGADRYLVRPGRPLRKTGCCGEINFHRGRITTEIASHEIGHAALGWARRVGLPGIKLSPKDWQGDEQRVTDDEERFCYALGRMVQQFADRAFRYKLWEGVTWERSKG
jgi:hypothetical protein